MTTQNPESDIDSVYVLVALPNGVCFAARDSGLYRSDDGGETWRSAYTSLRLDAPLSTTALVVSPAFAQDRTLLAGVPGGILKSTDGAQTWSAIPLHDPPPLLSSLAISPAYSADGFVLATTFRLGVFYSADRGETWLTGNFSLLDLHVLTSAVSPAFAQDRTILIGTETGVFSSRNGGRSWDVVDLPYVAVTSLAFASGDVIYVGSDGDGLYRSSDKGLTWTYPALESTLAVSLVLTPSERDVLVFAGETLYRSRDAGATWTPHKLRASVTAAAVLQSEMLLVGYSDGTISRMDLPF